MIERIVNNMTSNNFKNTFHNNNLLKKSFIFSLNVVLTCFLKRIIDASKSSFTARHVVYKRGKTLANRDDFFHM